MKLEFIHLHDVIKEVCNLAQSHHDDAIEPKSKCLSIDWDYYLNLSLSGCFMGVVMRDEQGIMRGYSFYQVTNDPLNKEKKVANCDVIFIKKEYRGKNTFDMLKFADEHLKKLSVDETTYVFHDQRLGKILARNGYKPEYTVWSLKNE